MWAYLCGLPGDVVRCSVTPLLQLSDIARLESAAVERRDSSIICTMAQGVEPVDMTIETQWAVSGLQWVIDHDIAVRSIASSDAFAEVVDSILDRANVVTSTVYLRFHQQAVWMLSCPGDSVRTLLIERTVWPSMTPHQIRHLVQLSKLVRLESHITAPIQDTIVAMLINFSVCLEELVLHNTINVVHSMIITGKPVTKTLRVFQANVYSSSLLSALAVSYPHVTGIHLCCKMRLARTGFCEGMRRIALNCRGLETLEVTNIGADEELARFVTHATSLHTLRLSHTLFTNEALLALSLRQPLRPLIELCAAWEVLSCVTIAHCRPALLELRTLKLTRHAQATTWKDGKCHAFATALQHMPNLQSLTMDDGVTTFTLRAITEHCHGLTELRLTDRIPCDVTTQDALAAALVANPILKILQFGRAPLTDRVLLSMAPHCHSLTELRVESSKTPGDIGLEALVRACPRLAVLDLPRNFVLSDSTVLALAECCRHLRRVNFGQCARLTESALVTLVSACRKLVELQVPASCLSKDTCAMLLHRHAARGLRIERDVPSPYLQAP